MVSLVSVVPMVFARHFGSGSHVPSHMYYHVLTCNKGPGSQRSEASSKPTRECPLRASGLQRQTTATE